jgi:hypothetical protein
VKQLDDNQCLYKGKDGTLFLAKFDETGDDAFDKEKNFMQTHCTDGILLQRFVADNQTYNKRYLLMQHCEQSLQEYIQDQGEEALDKVAS